MLNEFMLRGDAKIFNIDVKHHILASPLNMNSFNIDVEHHLLASPLNMNSFNIDVERSTSMFNEFMLRGDDKR
jgi:hypothetical protein